MRTEPPHLGAYASAVQGKLGQLAPLALVHATYPGFNPDQVPSVGSGCFCKRTSLWLGSHGQGQPLYDKGQLGVSLPTHKPTLREFEHVFFHDMGGLHGVTDARLACS